MTPLLKCEEYIAYHGNGDMADYPVIVSQLDFFLQVQIMLHHFEKHFNVPSLPVDPDNLRIGQVDFGRKYSQPASFMAMTHKNNFYLLGLAW